MNLSRYCAPGAAAILALSCQVGSGSVLAAEESPHVLTANVALTSNYLYRGISQTNNGPAAQGGFDYMYKPWSLYASAWGSSVDSSSASGFWYTQNAAGQTVLSDAQDPTATYQLLTAPGYDGAPMELDLKAGWAPTFGKLGLDIGYLRYQYPGTKTQANNTNEYHAGLSYDVMGYFTPKYVANYSPNFFGYKGAWYHDLSVTVPLPFQVTLAGHYGFTRYDNSPVRGGGENYDDYSVSLSRELYKGVVLTAAWVSRSRTYLCAPPFQCGNSGVFTLSKVF